MMVAGHPTHPVFISLLKLGEYDRRVEQIGLINNKYCNVSFKKRFWLFIVVNTVILEYYCLSQDVITTTGEPHSSGPLR